MNKNTNHKNTKYLAAAAVTLMAVLPLSACGSNGPAWQDALAAHLSENPDIEDACVGLSLLNAKTPEQVGALVLAFDEGDLPSGSTTIGKYLADDGRSVDDLPFDMPADVTVREVANEAGSIVLERCGL